MKYIVFWKNNYDGDLRFEVFESFTEATTWVGTNGGYILRLVEVVEKVTSPPKKQGSKSKGEK